jgi:hypothetical protein
MDVTRKLGILVVCMVPAIIGGGFVYHFTGSYASVAVWEVLLAIFAGAFISR